MNFVRVPGKAEYNMRCNMTLDDFLNNRHGTAFRLKKYRNYRRIIATIQATFLQNKGYFKGDLNVFEWYIQEKSF